MELYLPQRDHRGDGHSRRRYFIRGILSPKIKRGRGMRMYVDTGNRLSSSARSRVNLDMIRRRNANTTVSLVTDSR